MKLTKEAMQIRDEAIVKKVQEGLSYAQIAAIFQITRGRVWQIFRRYRRKPNKTAA